MDRDHLGGEHALEGVARADIGHRRDRGADPVGAGTDIDIERRRHVEGEGQIVHQPAMHPRIVGAGGAAQGGIAVGEAQHPHVRRRPGIVGRRRAG